MRTRLRESAYALAFLLPFLFTLGVFFVYAFVRTLYFSFTDYNLFQPPQWVGFGNYLRILSEPLFLRALRNTVAFSVIVTGLQTMFALAVAAVLNQKIRGITFFRTVYYLPSVLSSAAITLIFLWIYQRTGFFNYALSWLSTYYPYLLWFAGLFVLLQAVQVMWERSQNLPVSLYDPALATVSLLLAGVSTALLGTFGIIGVREWVVVDTTWLNTRREWFGVPVPLWAIMFQNIYTTVPTMMLIYLAGLQGIPRSLYEAAAIDGAGVWQQFTRVTVPMLKPVTFLVVTLGLIGTLQIFDQVAIFGDAAPLDSRVTLAYYVYHNAFPPGATPRIGLASAGAVTLALITLFVVLLQRRFGISEGAH